MAYSNDLEQIRDGFMNYIGAAISAIDLEGRAKNQVICGMLCDAVLGCAQMEPKTPCDPYILVPLFKANIIFLRQQMNILSQNPTEQNKKRMLTYQAMIEVYDGLIKENSPRTKA